MKLPISLCLVAAVICVLQPGANSENILMVEPMLGGSHFQMLVLLGTKLAAEGHNVTMIMSECSIDQIPISKHINYRHWPCAASKDVVSNMLDNFSRKALSGELSSINWYAKLWLGLLEDPIIEESIELSRSNNQVFQNAISLLTADNFSLAICDIMMPLCSVVVHDVLRIPYVNVANGGPLGTRYTRWMNVPSPLSYVPEYLTHFTESMTFMERTQNLLMHAVSLLIFDVINLSGIESARKAFGNMSDVSTRDIISQSSLFILNWDFVLEYPRPLPPNMIFAGGISTRPPNALPAEFEAFVQGSGEEGLLVFSVSTFVDVMDGSLADMIATALARLPLRVVWKFKGDKKPPSLGNNTMPVAWLPQGDLLGHSKTEVFVFHGGINGVYEAIYHGIPAVGIPLFADQADNLLRLQSLGMAEFMPEGIRTATSESLYQLIMQVASNPRYKTRAAEVSAIFRAQPDTPVDRAAFWVDHVIRQGADHLRPTQGNLSWVSRTLLDVTAVLAALGLLLVGGLWLCFSALCRRARRCM